MTLGSHRLPVRNWWVPPGLILTSRIKARKLSMPSSHSGDSVLIPQLARRGLSLALERPGKFARPSGAPRTEGAQRSYLLPEAKQGAVFLPIATCQAVARECRDHRTPSDPRIRFAQPAVFQRSHRLFAPPVPPSENLLPSGFLMRKNRPGPNSF